MLITNKRGSMTQGRPSDDSSLLSVVICSHNPRPTYLHRVLNALQAQSLPLIRWELLLIDNASTEPLASHWDLSWHTNARHVREDELGITPARLRGFSEARGHAVIFVDDDNVLDSDYLTKALDIARAFPFLGAWGGSVRPEFEIEPEEWTREYWGYLAIRTYDRPHWSNNPKDWDCLPCGAGLCVRRNVGEHYRDRVAGSPMRRALDRKGRSLASCGDIDLARCAVYEGLGFGVFPQLGLTHLIPSSRLTEEYLVRLAGAMAASGTILESFWHRQLPPGPTRFWTQLRFAWKLARYGRRTARFFRARQNGIRYARQMLDGEWSDERAADWHKLVEEQSSVACVVHQ
jgi:glycosyltransferase involved in cell wall biosynthesis